YDAQQRTPPWPSSAIGQQRIICDDSVHPDENCVGPVAKLLDMGASLRTGDPSAGGIAQAHFVAGWRVRRSDLAVQRHARLESYQRRSMDNVLGKRFVQSARFCFQQPNMNFDSGSAQPLESFARNGRIGILHRGIDTRYAGSDHGVRAWPAASGMRAGFEIQ